jgi:hypothetical protein
VNLMLADIRLQPIIGEPGKLKLKKFYDLNVSRKMKDPDESFLPFYAFARAFIHFCLNCLPVGLGDGRRIDAGILNV